MKKITIKRVLSNLHLLYFLENINFIWQKIKNKKSNDLFIKENPSVKLPPDFYLYETFNLNYKKFYSDGISTTKWLLDHLKEFKHINNLSILDWGCGAGRIIRHLPSVAGVNNSYFGCDYNEKYINWCSKNIVNVAFKLNRLDPPLDFDNNSFDIIYGISIFTHLSNKMHFLWMKELSRVLKNDGIIFITAHGDSFKNKLLEKEKVLFDSGKLVVHKYKKEGNRLFASYQPPSFIENLCEINNLVILKHIPGVTNNNKSQQDIWIISNKSLA